MFYVYVQPYDYFMTAERIFKRFIGHRFAQESSWFILIENPWMASDECRIPQILIIFMHAVLAHLSMRWRV